MNADFYRERTSGVEFIITAENCQTETDGQFQ